MSKTDHPRTCHCRTCERPRNILVLIAAARKALDEWRTKYPEEAAQVSNCDCQKFETRYAICGHAKVDHSGMESMGCRVCSRGTGDLVCVRFVARL